MPLATHSPLVRSSTPILPFSYTIVHSQRRRSISIEVAKAQVRILAPSYVSAQDVEKFGWAKSLWVQQKLAQQQQQLREIPERTYHTGSELPFLGQRLTLSLHKQSQADVAQYAQQLRIGLSSRSRLADEEQARRLVNLWYQRQALQLLTLKTNLAVNQLRLKHTGVTIKATRSKWGHCTARGAIQYNWQIVLAPEPIVDYLVAHEVSHLRHHNHSPEFWQLVASLCPDYKTCRVWLKTNGMQLTL